MYYIRKHLRAIWCTHLVVPTKKSNNNVGTDWINFLEAEILRPRVILPPMYYTSDLTDTDGGNEHQN